MSTAVWWRRQRSLLDFALAGLLRRKVKNGALLLGYTLIVFILTSVLFFAEAVRQEAVAVLAGSPEMVVQRMSAGRYTPIPLTYGQTIAAIRGVGRVTPRWWGYYYHPSAGANYTVMAADMAELQPGTAEVGSGVARTWQTTAGGYLYFNTFDGRGLLLTVNRLLPVDTELVSADLILVTQADFQRIFGMDPSLASDFGVAVRNRREARTIAEKIVNRLPDARPILREEIQRTYTALFDWRSGYLMAILGSAVLAFFIFALDKVTGLSAEERSEIAVLKAVGWDTSDVLLLKFYESLSISFTAFVLGVLGAYLHVYFAQAPLFEHALKGWGVLYPRLQLAPSINFYQLTSALAFTVMPYALVTIVPAWQAAITDPDTVMRQF